MQVRELLRIGVVNTLRMNLYYFGWGGVIRPRILASRNLKIIQLGGSIVKPKNTGYIKIGLNDIRVFDRKYERCLWKNRGEIIVKGRLTLGQGVRIDNNARLEFGDGVSIQANSTIICYKSIQIASDVLISWDNLIMDTDFHKIYRQDIPESKEEREPVNVPSRIVIGNHTWIGCRCLILKGSVIPSNSIVAAGSTITKEFTEEHTIIGSNKLLRKNVDWMG